MTGRNSPPTATAIEESPAVALQDQDHWGPYRFGIHPVKASTRSGMEQILAALTPYLAAVCLGTVACATAPQRLIVSRANDRSVMSGKRCRKETAVSFSSRSNGGTSPILSQHTAFFHRQKSRRLCPNSAIRCEDYRSQPVRSLRSRNLAIQRGAAKGCLGPRQDWGNPRENPNLRLALR
jgi:hypothetical protein